MGDDGVGVAGIAPRDRADAGGQFGEVEGLHQIVVGPRVQPLDPVADLVERGQDDDRRHIAPGPQAAQELDAAAIGQHQVQQHQVVSRRRSAHRRPRPAAGPSRPNGHRRRSGRARRPPEPCRPRSAGCAWSLPSLLAPRSLLTVAPDSKLKPRVAQPSSGCRQLRRASHHPGWPHARSLAHEKTLTILAFLAVLPGRCRAGGRRLLRADGRLAAARGRGRAGRRNGWTVRRIKIDDGCYEIDGRDARAAAIEVKRASRHAPDHRVRIRGGRPTAAGTRGAGDDD
jgi:hypothetical protein